MSQGPTPAQSIQASNDEGAPLGMLKRFWQRLDVLVNGTFAGVSKSRFLLVEIAGALQQACDNSVTIWNDERAVVPNDFVVGLSTDDYKRLNPHSGELGRELAGLVRDYAEQQRYSFVGPVEVHLEAAEDLDTGLFRVLSRTLASATQAPPQAQRAQPRTEYGYPLVLAAPPMFAQPVMTRGVRPPGSPRMPDPQVRWIEINGTRHPISGPALVLGRSPEADVRIDDPGVSRRHCEIRTGPPPTIQALGSTNGIVVDGQHTTRATLRDGSRIVVGSTTIIYRQVKGHARVSPKPQQDVQVADHAAGTAPYAPLSTATIYTAEDVAPAADSLDSALDRLFVRLGPPPGLTDLQFTPEGSDDGEAQE